MAAPTARGPLPDHGARHDVPDPDRLGHLSRPAHRGLPDEEAGLRRCVGILYSIANNARRYKSPVALLRWGLRPITTLMAACGLSADAQAVILAENGDYTWPPHRTPATFHAGFLDHYLQAGAYYPRGGGR